MDNVLLAVSGLGSVIVICTFAGLQTLAGASFLSLLLKKQQQRPWPLSFHVAGGYFLGVSVFLAVYRTAAQLLTRADAGMFVASLALFVFIILGIRNKSFQDFVNPGNWKRLSIFILVFILVALFLVIPCAVIPAAAKRLFYFLGPLHSGRYADIAQYICTVNIVPILPQNYGQSILATIPYYAGLKTLYFNLYVWLMITKFFVVLFSWGLLRSFGITGKNAVLGVLVLVMGNTALSLTHVLVIDSGSPLLLNGYTDSLVGLITFIIFLKWLFISTIHNNRPYWLIECLFMACFALTWCMTSAQNIILFFGFSVCVIAFMWFKEKNQIPRFLYILAVLAVFTFLGRMQGGMLSPQSIITQANIPGVMSVYQNYDGKYSGKKVMFSPSLSCRIGYAGDWSSRSIYSPAESKRSLMPYMIEDEIWSTLRIIMFPLIGLTGLLFLTKFKINSLNNNPQYNFAYLFTLSSIIIFAGGLFIAYFFVVNEYKWELSRFLIPGYYMAMTALVVFVNYMKSGDSRWRILSGNVLLVLTLIGPVWSCLFYLWGH